MESQQKKAQNILVLGGTNFMGKQLFDQLQTYVSHNHDSNIQIYYINRGKKYWNNQAKTQHPDFKHYYGDRSDHTDFTRLIEFINRKIGISQTNPWKAVIDFSAFKWRDVQSVVKAINGKVNRYIFISTESIYNTSIYKLQSPVGQQNFDLQQNYQQLKLSDKKSDKYGYNKMKCQLYLKRTKYVPYFCLRLPDVIGPYDNTDRFWCYIKWIKQCAKFPIPLNQNDKQNKLNFVYSLDVARFIVKLIKNVDQRTPSDSYNLMFNCEPPTLKQFLEKMGKAMNIQRVNFKDSKAKSTNNFYPSTSFGFITAVNAEKQLGWESTSIDKAISDSVRFYQDKGDNYPEEKRSIQKKFKQEVILDQY